MNAALLEKPDVSAWTQEDVMKWFDLDGIDTSAFENIYAELKATAKQAPQGVKDEIIQNYKDSIPTAEEIKDRLGFIDERGLERVNGEYYRTDRRRINRS